MKNLPKEPISLEQDSQLNVLNILPDTILVVHVTGQIKNIYGADENRIQHPIASKENEGKNLDQFLPVFIAKGVIFNLQKAIETQNTQHFEFIDTQNKITQYFEARINHFSPDEGLIVLRNMNALKLNEKALQKKLSRIEQEKRVLQKYIDNNLEMENFAYIASHDLREPLRTLRNFGQLLDRNIRNEIDDKNRSYLDFMIDAANRMTQLIDDLLTYSRTNTEPFEREAINITSILSQSIHNLHDEVDKANVQLIVKNIPTTIYGSTHRIQQLFENMLENAIKFHRKDVKSFVKISSKETPTHWHFSIEDNGIGIAEDFFNDIFIVFKRLHSRERYPGTGIGLALAKRIVGQHEGELWVASKEGQGSTFHFTLLK